MTQPPFQPDPSRPTRSAKWRELTQAVRWPLAVALLGAAVMFIVMIAMIASWLQAFSTDWGTTDAADDTRGANSVELWVKVSPSQNLHHGAEVRVTSDAFRPSEIVGVAVCLEDAQTKSLGISACDQIQGARFATTPDGSLDVSYRVPQMIRVPASGVHDCAIEPCVVVAARISDYNQSGGEAIQFAAGLATPSISPPTTRAHTDLLSIGTSTQQPVTPGSDLAVLASGFEPGEPLLLAWCTTNVEQRGPAETCEPMDFSAAGKALVWHTLPRNVPTADANGNVALDIATTDSIEVPSAITLFVGDGDDGTANTGSPEHVESCLPPDGRCAIVVAAAADTRRSAVLPYKLTPR